jgi:hypothetical protein
VQNNFFVEKNPTIVNFPVKNLELRDIIPVPEGGVFSSLTVTFGIQRVKP